MTESAEDPLVAKAFKTKNYDEFARAIAELTPDEAAFFLHKLENALRKRKIELGGYLAAMATWLVTMVLALIYYGTQAGFVEWVFLVPFACVGVILYTFGRWARRVGSAPAPPPAARPLDSAKP